jgi:hypothetical protein
MKVVKGKAATTKKQPRIEKAQNLAMVNEEELKELNNLKRSYDDDQFRVGGIEAQKANILSKMSMTSAEFEKKMEAIGKKYGKGNVDLKTGVITLQ